MESGATAGFRESECRQGGSNVSVSMHKMMQVSVVSIKNELEISCFQEDRKDITHSILPASKSQTLERVQETNKREL